MLDNHLTGKVVDFVIFGSVKPVTERILVIEGVPQSEQPRTLLFGFTLSFSLGAILVKHTERNEIKICRQLLLSNNSQRSLPFLKITSSGSQFC